jgi:catechol 2,3-dioxygenase-like lactoylglutathione lyase family enzyme
VVGAEPAQLALAVADLTVELVDQAHAGVDRALPRLRQSKPRETIVFLTHGDAKLELLGGGATESSPVVTDVADSLNPARLHHFCIAVDDLDATLEELRARGVTILGEPFDVPPIGQRVAFINDNSGNVIEITQPGT